MPFTTLFRDDIGDLLFLNTGAPNVGDGTGLPAAGTVGSTQLSLATVAYVAGDTVMTADECDYTGYTRPTQARSGAGWTSVDGAIANAALEQFGEKTAGADDTAVDFGLSFLSTGDVLQWYGNLDSSLAISDGVNPQFAIGALDLTIT